MMMMMFKKRLAQGSPTFCCGLDHHGADFTGGQADEMLRLGRRSAERVQREAIREDEGAELAGPLHPARRPAPFRARRGRRSRGVARAACRAFRFELCRVGDRERVQSLIEAQPELLATFDRTAAASVPAARARTFRDRRFDRRGRRPPSF